MERSQIRTIEDAEIFQHKRQMQNIAITVNQLPGVHLEPAELAALPFMEAVQKVKDCLREAGYGREQDLLPFLGIENTLLLMTWFSPKGYVNRLIRLCRSVGINPTKVGEIGIDITKLQ